MANKQHEMLFKLGARLGENFKGTFNSAQKVLAATQKEIQALNKQQSDLQSYQKLQNGIEKTNSRLEMYRGQLRNVEKELQASGNANSELQNRQLALTQRIHETEQRLSDQNARLRQMGENLTQAGVDINDIIPSLVRMDEQMEELARQEEQAAQEANNFGSSGESAFEAVGSALVAAGLATALKKIAEAYKECVQTSMEFGATISTVEALSGSNAVQMQELTAKAKELGAETAFTANQAASAMTYMGMAGWDAEEMLAGMDGMINLAAASGEDLALVSDIVTDNLTAFGLTAKDTAHFADVLAAAATNSNTNVAIMGETFSGAAAIAGALGYSIEDVAVGVGLMANAGVKGSVAGTALKNTFNGLLNGATLTAKAFGEVEYSAINSDGTIDRFSDTIVELRGYFDQMTEAERVQNAMLLAGQRGYNGLLAILNSTESDYQALTNEINNCAGAAQKMADIKLDNLQGDVTLLESATDGLKMTIGDMYDNELRSAAQLGADIISGINEFCKKNPEVVKAIMAVVGATGLLVSGYTTFNFVKKVKNTYDALNNVLTAQSTAATAAETGAIDAETGAIVTNTAATQAGTAAKIAHAAAIAGVVVAAAAVVGELVYYADAIWGVSAAVEDTQKQTQDIIDTMNDSMAQSKAEASVLQEKVAVYDELRNKQDRSLAEQKRLDDIAAELQDTLGGEVTVVNELTGEYNDLSNAVQSYIDNQSKKVRLSALEDAAKDAYAQIDEINRQMEKRTKENQEYQNNFSFGRILDYNGAVGLQSYMNDMGAYQAQITELEGVIAEYEEALRGETEAEVENAEAVATLPTAYDAVSSAVNGVTEQTAELLQAYNDAYQAAYDSVNGQYNLWTEAEETIPTSIDTINNALSSQTEYWDNYNYNLDTLSERAGDIEGLSDVIASFADGSSDSVNVIAGMADATDEELEAMVQNFKEQQKAQEEVSKSLAEYKIDIDEQMDELVDDMEQSIEDMDLSDSAEAAAKATIQAYADAILAGKGAAVDAAEIVANASAYALSNVQGYDQSTYYGYTKVAAQNAYASGTDYAEKGIALVGEEGPELVAMRGGEKVIDAENTKALLSGGAGVQISIAPQFVVNGEVGEITENKLQEMSAQLIDMVKDALEEAGIDRQRSVYA